MIANLARRYIVITAGPVRRLSPHLVGILQYAAIILDERERQALIMAADPLGARVDVSDLTIIDRIACLLRPELETRYNLGRVGDSLRGNTRRHACYRNDRDQFPPHDIILLTRPSFVKLALLRRLNHCCRENSRNGD